jgi:hypothetical protein
MANTASHEARWAALLFRRQIILGIKRIVVRSATKKKLLRQ